MRPDASASPISGLGLVGPANVSVGSKATKIDHSDYFRLSPNNGLMHRAANGTLFDHLVGT
jgi:hypothetical protein